MRQTSFSVYNINELSVEAKAKAIKALREIHLLDHADEALNWAIDDCSLLEPPHGEMSAILGEDYYERNAKEGFGQFVFKNLRKGVYCDLEEGTIGFEEGVEITNREMFLLWLGIPAELHDKVEYEIKDGMCTTMLETYWVPGDDEETPPDELKKLESEIIPLLNKAEAKFLQHSKWILSRIQEGYEWYFSEENIEAMSEGIEFFEDGTIYPTNKYKKLEFNHNN